MSTTLSKVRAAMWEQAAEWTSPDWPGRLLSAATDLNYKKYLSEKRRKKRYAEVEALSNDAEEIE